MIKALGLPKLIFPLTWMRAMLASLVFAPAFIHTVAGQTGPISHVVVPNTYTFHLSTNSALHPGTEPYMIVKGHVAGMVDLGNLCSSTKREAAFLYSPQRRTWLNLVEGYREGPSDYSVKTFTLVERFVHCPVLQAMTTVIHLMVGDQRRI